MPTTADLIASLDFEDLDIREGEIIESAVIIVKAVDLTDGHPHVYWAGSPGIGTLEQHGLMDFAAKAYLSDLMEDG